MIPLKSLASTILTLALLSLSSSMHGSDLSSDCGKFNLQMLVPEIHWNELFAETQKRLVIQSTASSVMGRSGLYSEVPIPANATGKEMVQFMIIESIKLGKFQEYKSAIERIYPSEKFESLAALNQQVLDHIQKSPSGFLDGFTLKVRGNVPIKDFDQNDLRTLAQVPEVTLLRAYFRIEYNQFQEAPLNQSPIQNAANFLRWAYEHNMQNEFITKLVDANLRKEVVDATKRLFDNY